MKHHYGWIIILLGALVVACTGCKVKHQCVKMMVVGGPGLLVTNYKDGISMIVLDTNYIKSLKPNIKSYSRNENDTGRQGQIQVVKGQKIVYIDPKSININQ